MFRPAVALTLISLGLAGCQSGSSGSAPAVPVAPPAVGGLMAGALGQSLSESDREKGWAAEQAALEGSKRTTWRGDKGNYGFVEPGALSGNCRLYTHSIYIDGRPQKGSGNACKGSDGLWK